MQICVLHTDSNCPSDLKIDYIGNTSQSEYYLNLSTIIFFPLKNWRSVHRGLRSVSSKKKYKSWANWKQVA